MSTYRVAGGIFQDLNGKGLFSLVCPSPGEPPYMLEEGKSSHFKLIWENAHLYQVEDDYTLTLVDLSPQALDWGVLGPERVTPDPVLFKKLQTAFKALPAYQPMIPSYIRPLLVEEVDPVNSALAAFPGPPILRPTGTEVSGEV